MAADQHSSGAPWRNFYGRFKGKTLRPGQEEALESDLAQLSPGPVSWTENPDRAALDLAQMFNASAVWLEIGFGGGEHLVHQAVQNPETGLIGCEPYINGGGNAAAKNSPRRGAKYSDLSGRCTASL